MHNEQQQIRAEILEAFKDADRVAWEKFQIAKLVKRHSVVLELAWEKHLKDLVDAVQAELEAEEIEKLSQQAYITGLMIAGYDLTTATLIAQGCPAFIWAPKLGF